MWELPSTAQVLAALSRSLRSIAAVLVVTCAASAPLGAEAASPATLTRPGFYTMADLGLSGTNVGRPERGILPRGAVFMLPNDAAQGSPLWYLIRLRLQVRMTLARTAQHGVAYVGASTNGYACAMIRFEPRRQNNGQVRTHVSTSGIIDGMRQRIASTESVAVEFANYLQLRGVKPGLNTVEFRTERYGGARIERLEILEDSGMEISRRGPGRIVMTTRTTPKTVIAGEAFRVSIGIANHGGRDVGQVALRALPEPGYVDLVRRKRGVRQVLRAGDQTTDEFSFRAKRGGTFQIAFEAASASNQQAVVLNVRATRKRTESDTGGVFAALALAGGVVGAVVAVARRYHQRSR